MKKRGRKRSYVLLLFSILLILAGLITGAASINDLLKGPLANSVLGSTRGGLGSLVQQPPVWYFYFMAFAYLVVSVVAFINGIGLLMLRKWVVMFCFIQAGIGIGIALINLISLMFFGLFFQLINSLFGFFITVLFYSLLIYFLTRKSTKKLFY